MRSSGVFQRVLGSFSREVFFIEKPLTVASDKKRNNSLEHYFLDALSIFHLGNTHVVIFGEITLFEKNFPLKMTLTLCQTFFIF